MAEQTPAQQRAALLEAWWSGKSEPALDPAEIEVYGGASGRDTLLAWAEAQGWSDSDWDIALYVLSMTGLNRCRLPSAGGR